MLLIPPTRPLELPFHFFKADGLYCPTHPYVEDDSFMIHVRKYIRGGRAGKSRRQSKLIPPTCTLIGETFMIHVRKHIRGVGVREKADGSQNCSHQTNL